MLFIMLLLIFEYWDVLIVIMDLLLIVIVDIFSFYIFNYVLVELVEDFD